MSGTPAGPAAWLATARTEPSLLPVGLGESGSHLHPGRRAREGAGAISSAGTATARCQIGRVDSTSGFASVGATRTNPSRASMNSLRVNVRLPDQVEDVRVDERADGFE